MSFGLPLERTKKCLRRFQNPLPSSRHSCGSLRMVSPIWASRSDFDVTAEIRALLDESWHFAFCKHWLWWRWENETTIVGSRDLQNAAAQEIHSVIEWHVLVGSEWRWKSGHGLIVSASWDWPLAILSHDQPYCWWAQWSNDERKQEFNSHSFSFF